MQDRTKMHQWQNELNSLLAWEENLHILDLHEPQQYLSNLYYGYATIIPIIHLEVNQQFNSLMAKSTLKIMSNSKTSLYVETKASSLRFHCSFTLRESHWQFLSHLKISFFNAISDKTLTRDHSFVSRPNLPTWKSPGKLARWLGESGRSHFLMLS